MSNISTLRAVASRLTSTPIEDLPHQIGYLATSIASCQGLLQNASSSNDHATLLHKLKTRVSALLQDRTPEGRFCGIVIAKAVVEVGGFTILADSGNWVRAIISCLNKSDSAEVRKLGILTVTRIYLLTVEHQQLVREITTPTLPAFISATLGVVRPSTTTIEGKIVRALSPLLEVVLRSWDTLIEHFPSTIRPNSASIKSICLSLVSDDACATNVQQTAQEVLAKLHYCAPKNTATVEWSQSCSQIVDAAHDTADLVLRAVVEDWSSSTTRTSKMTRKQKSASTPSVSTADMAGLDPWTGVSQGATRITSHLNLLQHFLTNCHSSQMNVPLGAIFDLTSRLSAITVPSSKFTPRTNNDITRDEREGLWLNLPRIHTSILQLYRNMVTTFGQVLYPLCNTVSSHIWDIFEAEHEYEPIRTAAYQLVSSMLSSRTLSFSKSDSANVKLLTTRCCDDLQPYKTTPSSQLLMTNGNSTSKAPNNGTAQFSDLSNSKSKQPTTSSTQTTLYSSAHALLPALLTYANLHILEGSSTIRANLDSTAILINHHEAILASVLYPHNSRGPANSGKQKTVTPSLLPFLARSMEVGGGADMSGAEKLGFEALLRPRMPVVPTTTDKVNGAVGGEDQEGDGTEDEEDTIMHDGDIRRDLAADRNRQLSPHQSENTVESTNTNPSTKRDFTTLLEQSANEQLAASAAENTNTAIPLVPTTTVAPTPFNRETPTPKRQKTADEPAISEPQALQTQKLPITASEAVAASHGHNLRSTTLDTSITPQNNSVPSSNMQPREQIQQKSNIPDDNDDSDSDSDIPLIDATLVGMSDSEDDNEDEEEA